MYLEAFAALRDDRDVYGMGHIYFFAIDAWATRHHLPESEFPTFHVLIREMDAEYLLWVSEEIEKAKPKEPPQ